LWRTAPPFEKGEAFQMKGSFMETEFLAYLQNLNYYAEQHNTDMLLPCRLAVAEAEQGRLRKLSGIFLDFPLIYFSNQTDTSKPICAVSMNKYERWVRHYAGLLLQGNFELVTHMANPLITVDGTTQEAVKKFNLDIIVNACVALLENKNQLRPEVIQFFGLQKLIAQHESHPVGIKKIIYHMVYSYWLEIVTVNLGLTAIRQDCDIRQLEALNGYSKALLREEKRFAPFFMECIKMYNDHFTQDEALALLRDLPADRVTGKLSISVQAMGQVEDAF
jgi:hypothetical protein